MSYDNWLTNDIARENAEAAYEAREEEMSWPPVNHELAGEANDRLVAAIEKAEAERDRYRLVLEEIRDGFAAGQSAEWMCWFAIAALDAARGEG